jgi:Leucine-rich repeat (LRR) protein
LLHLDLAGNQLRELPKELGQLAQLEELDLAGNQLRELPKELGRLAQVRWLDLSGNQLRALPAELGHLRELDGLDLVKNPPRRGLSLDNNPHLRHPPPEVVAAGTKAILAYLRAQQSER